MNKSITNNIITNYNESFKTKIIINLIIILILILLIAIFKGPLFIKTTHNNLYYELFLDNEKIDKYTVNETYKSPLIPPFIYYKDYTSKNYNLNTNTYFRKDELDNFKLKVKSCYINNQNTSCQKKYDSTKNLDYKKNNLSMTILDGSYNFDRTQLLFRFVADERVDFRNLARELGSIFKTRIELRQIGIRDKSKEVGGIGPCGRILCCTSFLNSFDSVTISMAKNQGVSLNPTKINGVCGRLLCCLKYENDVYSYNKKDLPRVGSKVSISNKQGKVTFVNILKKEYTVIFNDGSKSVMKIN